MGGGFHGKSRPEGRAEAGLHLIKEENNTLKCIFSEEEDERVKDSYYCSYFHSTWHNAGTIACSNEALFVNTGGGLLCPIDFSFPNSVTSTG